MRIRSKALPRRLGLLMCLLLLAAAPAEAQVTSDMLVRADARPGDCSAPTRARCRSERQPCGLPSQG